MLRERLSTSTSTDLSLRCAGNAPGNGLHRSARAFPYASAQRATVLAQMGLQLVWPVGSPYEESEL